MRSSGFVRRPHVAPLCQAEVEDFDVPSIGDHDVAGLEVPVHHAGVMRRPYTCGNRDPVTKHVADGQSLRWNQTLECLPGDVLHRNRVPVFIADDVVDRDDIGMIQD